MCFYEVILFLLIIIFIIIYYCFLRSTWNLRLNKMIKKKGSRSNRLPINDLFKLEMNEESVFCQQKCLLTFDKVAHLD